MVWKRPGALLELRRRRFPDFPGGVGGTLDQQL